MYSIQKINTLFQDLSALKSRSHPFWQDSRSRSCNAAPAPTSISAPSFVVVVETVVVTNIVKVCNVAFKAVEHQNCYFSTMSPEPEKTDQTEKAGELFMTIKSKKSTKYKYYSVLTIIFVVCCKHCIVSILHYLCIINPIIQGSSAMININWFMLHGVL